MTDKIGESLGLEPMEKDNKTVDIEVPVIRHQETEQENDYQYARENFYNVIEKGSQALEDIIEVAKSSEHPRAFEVVATMIKTITDANKDLVKIGQEKAQARDKRNQEDGDVTNNNLFVGSTAELQQMLKEMKKDKIDNESD